MYVTAFWLLKVPKGMWRFSGFGEVWRLVGACMGAGAVCAAVVMAAGLNGVPRAVLALHPVVTLMALALVRMGYRMLYEHSRMRITGSEAEVRRALVLGAGEAARLLVAGIHRQGWIVLGLLDDDPHKHGGRIAGVTVLGPLSVLRDKTALGAATHLIIAMPSVRGARRREVLELAAGAGLPVVTVPSADELRDGNQRVDLLREIEPEDLLGREAVQLDEAGIAATLRGKTVLITGAGGSIGSELCRQVAHYQPARLVLYELSEFNLYSIEQDLGERFPALPLERLIGDVKDLAHLRHTMARTRPQVVFHAAAFKHVPLMEEGNALAALRNNTLGTHHAALAAAEAGVERFVLISTDKAVNPTNVMGATKRAAEMVVSALATRVPRDALHGRALRQRAGLQRQRDPQVQGADRARRPGDGDAPGDHSLLHDHCRGGAAGAAGGGDRRQWTSARARHGRAGAHRRPGPTLIRLAGRSADDVAIEFSGLRAGEKLYEELLADADTTVATRVPQLRVATLTQQRATLDDLLELASTSTVQADDATVRAALERAVPEYAIPDRKTDR